MIHKIRGRISSSTHRQSREQSVYIGIGIIHWPFNRNVEHDFTQNLVYNGIDQVYSVRTYVYPHMHTYKRSDGGWFKWSCWMPSIKITYAMQLASKNKCMMTAYFYVHTTDDSQSSTPGSVELGTRDTPHKDRRIYLQI